MELESPVGTGTAVRLIFATLAVAAAEPVPSAVVVAIPSPQRILLIDDDPLVSKTLCEVLKLDGHDVETANGGQEGIDAFRMAQERKALRGRHYRSGDALHRW